MTQIPHQHESEAIPSALTGEAMAEQFKRNLLQNEGALAYVESRGVKRSMIEEGLVGFCPPYSSHWFPLMRGRITVPIRDVHGRVIAFAGRIYEGMRELTERSLWDKYGDDPVKAEERVRKWRKGKWLNETFPKHKHLFNLDRAKNHARERGYLVIVEGYMDALILSSRHIQNVAAVCGVALSAHHAALISRYCKRVVLILDGDEAGSMALEKMMPVLQEADIDYHIVSLPDGYDPDEFAIKFGGKNLRRAIEKMIDEGSRELRINVDE